MTPVAQRDPEPGPDAFQLSPHRAKELWIWLRCGSSERRVILRDPASCATADREERQQLAFEEYACRHLELHYQHSFENFTFGKAGIYDSPWQRLRRGLDHAGVSIFSRFLEEHLRWWREGSNRPERERAAHLRVYEAASRLFYRLLGAEEEQVRRWTRRSGFGKYPEHRLQPWALWEDGFAPPISFPGVETEEIVDLGGVERWSECREEWSRLPALQDFPSVRCFDEPAPPAGQPNAGWQFGVAAYFEQQQRERDRYEAMPGAQRYWAGDPSTEVAAEGRIFERFVAVFPEPPPEVEYHRLHAQLSLPPIPHRLAAFLEWLREGAAQPGRADGSPGPDRAFGGVLNELEGCRGERKMWP